MVKLTVRFLRWIKRLQADPDPRVKLYPTPVQEFPPKLFKTDEPAYQDVHVLRPPPQRRHTQKCFVFLRRKEVNIFFDENPSTRRQKLSFLKNAAWVRRRNHSKNPPRRRKPEESYCVLCLGTRTRMRIPQDRTRTGRNSPVNKPDTKWSDDQIYTHPTNTLSILIKAIHIINNTPPVEQHPLPPNQQTGHNICARAHPNERSTRHHRAARRANTSAGDNKKSNNV